MKLANHVFHFYQFFSAREVFLSLHDIYKPYLLSILQNFNHEGARAFLHYMIYVYHFLYPKRLLRQKSSVLLFYYHLKTKNTILTTFQTQGGPSCSCMTIRDYLLYRKELSVISDPFPAPCMILVEHVLYLFLSRSCFLESVMTRRGWGGFCLPIYLLYL